MTDALLSRSSVPNGPGRLKHPEIFAMTENSVTVVPPPPYLISEARVLEIVEVPDESPSAVQAFTFRAQVKPVLESGLSGNWKTVEGNRRLRKTNPGDDRLRREGKEPSVVTYGPYWTTHSEF
jgi:hypothetical protein